MTASCHWLVRTLELLPSIILALVDYYIVPLNYRECRIHFSQSCSDGFKSNFFTCLEGHGYNILSVHLWKSVD